MTLPKNWQTTLLGILAGAAVVIKLINDWLVSHQGLQIGLPEILGLIVAFLGLRARDADTTPTGTVPK